MKLYRVEYGSADGQFYGVDHFKSKREALKRARGLIKSDPDGIKEGATVKVTKITTNGATPFEIAKSLGERNQEMLLQFFDYSGKMTREIVLELPESEA